MEEEKQKSFLERLREADDAVKRRWLIIGTSIVMIAVVFVWLSYFENLLKSYSPSPEPIIEESGFAVVEIMKNGTAIVLRGFLERARDFFDVFGRTQQFMITPPQ